MSKLRRYFCFFLFLPICLGCSRASGKYKLPLINIGGFEVADLDPQKLTNRSIKLSQLVEDIKVVQLQTTDSSMIANSTDYKVGEKYILAVFNDEIYQFSITGEFIRLVAKKGMGPGELNAVRKNVRYDMDEHSDLLYVSILDRLYLYKLSTGEFLGNKRLRAVDNMSEAISIVYAPDSLFIYSFYSRGGLPEDSLGCGIAVQDWGGDLICEKRFDFKTWTVYPPPINYELLHGSSIYVVKTDAPGEYIIQINNQDSSYVFSLDDFSIRPYLLVRTKGPLKGNYPVDYISVGSYQIKGEFNCTNNFQLMNMYLIKNLAGFPSSLEAYNYYILYDDKTKTAFNIEQFTDDYFGFIHSRDKSTQKLPVYPSFVSPSGKVLLTYEASYFLKLKEEKLKEPSLSPEIVDRINMYSRDLTEFSNPVLIIGKVRKVIRLD